MNCEEIYLLKFLVFNSLPCSAILLSLYLESGPNKKKVGNN